VNREDYTFVIEVLEQLPDLFRAERQHLGYSVADVAEEIGRPASPLGKWERRNMGHQNVCFDRLLDLLYWLQAHVDDEVT
jgi:ribosome-binding protein aMBF1 (putative translation factor)